MSKLVVLLLTGLALCTTILAQDNPDRTSQDEPILSASIGYAESLGIGQAFLVKGRKKERTFRSDYYESEGLLSVYEGDWSIIVAGIGGNDVTTYNGTDFPDADIELRASPRSCYSSWNLYSVAAKAFRIKCPLRSLRFELRSNSSHTLILITRLTPRNQTGVNLTARKAATATVAPRSTIVSAETLYETPSIAPTDSPAYSPSPSRTPRPTVDPESGTYYISRSGVVNVRSCASTTCSLVEKLQLGESVTVSGFEDGQTVGGSSRWARTYTGDYIHSSLLTRGSPPVAATPQTDLQLLLNSTLDSVVDSVTVTPSSLNVLIKTSLLHGDSDTLAEAAIKDIGKSICLLKNNGFNSYKLTYMGSHEADTEPFSIKFRSRAGTTSSFRCPVRQLSMEILLERLQPITEFSDVSDWLMSMTSLGW